MKIACWSGPRNLSTAMMYAFGARHDCAITDEPFYAAYLARTGLDHPMREVILASQSNDPAEVSAQCAGAVPDGKAHWYQKHMTHHMRAGWDLDWIEGLAHVFLIRHPARVLASYARKRAQPTLNDIGLVEQVRLFEEVTSRALPCVVMDSTDIRAAPAPALQALCAAIGLEWQPAMLRWAPGGHKQDGVWAAHWYDAVHRSSGFDGPDGPVPDVPVAARHVLNEAMPLYDYLAQRRLAP